MKKNLAKLVKKVITDKRGKKTTVWVKMGEAKNQPKHKKEIATGDDGTHSVEHNGSKYYSMPDESKEDFAKRATIAIKQDHKVDVEINSGSNSNKKKEDNK